MGLASSITHMGTDSSREADFTEAVFTVGRREGAVARLGVPIYWAVYPPSTTSSAPVTNFDSSDAR